MKMPWKRKSEIGRKYPLIRDQHDPRDFRFQHRTMLQSVQLPPMVDLSVTLNMPPCYDQGPYGTCGFNAAAGVVHTLMTPRWMPSRLFIGYNACALAGETTIAEDQGIAGLRNVIQPLTDKGFCCENSGEGPSPWPYDSGHLNTQPFPACYAEAQHHLVTSYERVADNDILAIKTALAAGHPIIFGIQVYAAFEDGITAADGCVPTPNWWDRLHGSLGGHAIVMVGYNDQTQKFKFRNSWGLWGDHGYGYLGYDFVSNSSLAFDFWLLDGVQNVS